jgi:hypothetical protein
MNSGGFVILADLSSNSKEFAIACEQGGANSVILHLNDDASNGSRFGGLDIEGQSLKDCMASVTIPLGIWIGDSRLLDVIEWEFCVNLGFSFVVMQAHHMPTFVWKDNRLPKFVGIGPGYILEQVKTLAEFEDVASLVASLTPAQGRGLPLNLFDVATLKLITSLSKKPVLYTTQRKVRPEDVNLLASEGCRGLVLKGSLYGSSDAEFKENVLKFKLASQRPQESS